MKFYVKCHQDHLEGKREVVAIADEDLIGEKLSDKDITFKVKNSFYRGELLDEKEMVEKMNDGDVLNLIGEESVRKGIEEEKVRKEDVMKIDGVPHAQSVIIKNE